MCAPLQSTIYARLLRCGYPATHHSGLGDACLDYLPSAPIVILGTEMQSTTYARLLRCGYPTTYHSGLGDACSGYLPSAPIVILGTEIYLNINTVKRSLPTRLL